MKRFFLTMLLITFTAGLTAVGALAFVYNSQTLDANKLTPQANTVQIYDNADTQMSDTKTNTVSIEQLPEHIKWAFICVEDKNFYKHNGVSYNRIAKAAFKNAKAGATKEGASTISQQLIKNTHLTHEKTFKRKIREAALAHKLEKKYSKDAILEMYLNAVYFGNSIYGLEAASRFYFDKSAPELTIRESAGLAGILRSPAHYDPISREQNFCDRTDFVLSMINEQGKISLEEYDRAKNEKITITGKRERNTGAAYRQAVIAQAVGLIRNGYKIYTFYDHDTQKAIANTLNNDDYKIKNISGKQSDSFIISATPQGHITALHTNNQSLLTGRRNFASALKPLAVYAPALELGVVNSNTIIKDEPYTSGDFHPRNYDNKFRGNVTVRQSLAHSYNIPAVKILEYTRLSRATDVARGLGLTLDDENLGLALGSTQKGISFMELLGGYCALAGEGLKTAPSFIKRIEDANGKVVWQYTEPHLRVLSENTCLTISDMLKLAVKEGTARKLGSLEFDVAAKTGTAERCSQAVIASEARQSHGNTDAVIVAYTPSNVLVVWHGNADMKPANDLPAGTTGGGITSYIARDIAKATNNVGRFKEPSEKFSHVIASGSVAIPPLREITSPTLTLTGRLGDTGAPELRFTARKGQTYEIMRNIGNSTSLLEVVKNHDGEYVYTDRNAIKDKIIEYWVQSQVATSSEQLSSNTVKIFCATEINKNTNTGKRSGGRHWFF